MPRILIQTPDGGTHEFELSAEKTRLGRAEDNDIVVPDGSVSSYHGEITLTDTGITFHDRGSTNGTHVNGQRVEQADIPFGSQFRLGSCEAVLVGDAEEAPAQDLHEAPEEEAPSTEPSYESAPAAVITGLGATPCPSSMRRGFGPKSKPKDSGGGLLMMLAVLGLLVCAGAVFMIFSMGA